MVLRDQIKWTNSFTVSQPIWSAAGQRAAVRTKTSERGFIMPETRAAAPDNSVASTKGCWA